MALQREDRNMGRNDDQHREQSWPADLSCGTQDGAKLVLFVGVIRRHLETMKDVLDHDYRAVDNDAKVHCAERQ